MSTNFLLLLLVIALLSLVAGNNSTAASVFSSSTAYDNNEALTSLWLSAAAYCGKSNYMTHVFKGPTTGFVVKYVIYDAATDTQGYVGILPSNKSIYVVYRGSQDIRNWVTNLDAVKTSYTSYPNCNCKVHKGFYDAEQKVIFGVISEVKSLLSSLSGYSVKVTGHSLGAALAQLSAMDITNAGIATAVYNFGQPRVGDSAYANFATPVVKVWRVTHNKDTVPHVPFTSMGFYHTCQEEFENASGSLKTCTNTCEDPSCADQYPYAETNIDDHLVYLGLPVSCDAVSAVVV